MQRAEAEAIYDAGREAVVRVLLELSAQNERLQGQVERLTTRVEKLERELAKNSRNSSQPPSADRPSTPPRRGKDPSGRKQGAQPGHEGKGRELLPASACDEVIVHWPERCDCGHGGQGVPRVRDVGQVGGSGAQAVGSRGGRS